MFKVSIKWLTKSIVVLRGFDWRLIGLLFETEATLAMVVEGKREVAATEVVVIGWVNLDELILDVGIIGAGLVVVANVVASDVDDGFVTDEATKTPDGFGIRVVVVVVGGCNDCWGGGGCAGKLVVLVVVYLLLYAELDEVVGIVASLDLNAELDGFSEFLGGDSLGKPDFFSTIWGFCTLRSLKSIK